MSTIRTFTGRSLDLFAFQPEDVDLLDIAHALSQVCRWSGHTSRFYSVAQHSCYVSDRVLETSLSLHAAMVGLLHDASEAYLGDMAAPLKRTAWAAGYRALEATVTGAIYRHFGFTDAALTAAWPEVHRADLELLATEARDLMGNRPTLDADVPPPLPDLIDPWTPARAEWWFLSAFLRLRGGLVYAGVETDIARVFDRLRLVAAIA